MVVIATPTLVRWGKVVAPTLVYCLTDYYYCKYHYSRRFVYPIPACYTALAHSILLVLAYVLKYFLTKSLQLPKVSATSAITSASLSLILQYDILDLNHNFGAPSYKVVTAVVLPLVMMKHGSDPVKCGGVFGAMFISALVGSNHIPVVQMFVGIFMCGVLYVGVMFLGKYRQEVQAGRDQMNRDAMIKFLLTIAIDILAGLVVCDVLLIYFDTNLAPFEAFNGTGVFLFATATIGKLLILYFSDDYGLSALAIAWVLKTCMFSMTYTLLYKFDLRVSNLLALVIGAVYIISTRIVKVVSDSKSDISSVSPIVIHHE